MKNQTVTVRVAFPCEIRQDSNKSIVLSAKLLDGPVLATGAIDKIAPDLSTAEQDRLVDDITLYAQSEGLKRSLVVTPTFTIPDVPVSEVIKAANIKY